MVAPSGQGLPGISREELRDAQSHILGERVDVGFTHHADMCSDDIDHFRLWGEIAPRAPYLRQIQKRRYFRLINHHGPRVCPRNVGEQSGEKPIDEQSMRGLIGREIHHALERVSAAEFLTSFEAESRLGN